MTDPEKLRWIENAQVIATLMVAIGVAAEFLGTYIARPIQQRVQSGLENQIATANARAAEANQKAEEERLARVRIEERLAPRSLGEQTVKELTAACGPLRGKAVMMVLFGDTPEIAAFGRQIAGAMRLAGVTVGIGSTISSGGATGMAAFARKDDAAAHAAVRTLVTVFGRAGFPLELGVDFTSESQMPAMMLAGEGPDKPPADSDTILRFFVGAK